jgi:hypothetical protein
MSATMTAMLPERGQVTSRATDRHRKIQDRPPVAATRC